MRNTPLSEWFLLEDNAISFIGNVIWFVFGGLIACIGYLFAGAVLCLTIVGIPFGLQTFKQGFAVLAPFGKEIVESPDANSPLRLVFNVIWIILFGWELALAHLIFALFFALTIVGIPFALQHLKLVPIALLPFGRDLV